MAAIIVLHIICITRWFSVTRHYIQLNLIIIENLYYIIIFWLLNRDDVRDRWGKQNRMQKPQKYIIKIKYLWLVFPNQYQDWFTL